MMMLLLVALVFIFTMYIMTMSLFLSGPAAWLFFFGLAVFWIGYRQIRSTRRRSPVRLSTPTPSSMAPRA